MNSKWKYIFLLCFIMTAASCALTGGVNLKREPIKDEKIITGDFSLILYGGTHGDALEALAVLDPEGDNYVFRPYAPEYDFTITGHMKGEEAIEEAIHFLGWHHLFMGAQTSRILDMQGQTIGYEIRPLYERLSLGDSDVLLVNYVLKDNNVFFYMQLKPHIEDLLNTDGGHKGKDSR